MEELKLYHYTNVSGFMSIIESNSIRVTRSDFMNDSNECSIFNKVLHGYLRKKENNFTEFEESSVPLIVKFDFSKYINFLEKHMHYYIFSLTTEKDNLPMWNYYGNNGIQLEFERSQFIKALEKSDSFTNGRMICGPIVYVNPEITLEEIKDLHVQLFDRENDQDIRNYIESINERDIIFKKGETVKNQSFLVKFINIACKDLAYTIDRLYRIKKINIEMDENDVFREVYYNIKSAHAKMEFKKEILYGILSLSSFLKTNSYDNEKEYRIVLLNDDLIKNEDETYFLSNYNSMDIMKPAIVIRKLDFNIFLKSVVLSPIMKNIPVNQERYINLITEFLSSNKIYDKSVGLSSHDIRW